MREKSMPIACNKQFSGRGEGEKRVVIIRLSFLWVIYTHKKLA